MNDPTDELYVGTDVLNSLRIDKKFVGHFYVAAGFSSLAFVVWILIAFFKSQWPWFVYIVGFFLLTLSYHYFVVIKDKKMFGLHSTWFAVINSVIFISWTYSGSPTAWFLYIFFILSMFLFVHWIYVKFSESIHHMLYQHVCVFFLLNFLLFCAWLESNAIFPWFVIVLSISGVFLTIHYHSHYNPGKYVALHFQVYVILNLLVFLIWAGASRKFPYFIFPLIIFGLIFFVHFFKYPDELEVSSSREPSNHVIEDDDREVDINI